MDVIVVRRAAGCTYAPLAVVRSGDRGGTQGNTRTSPLSPGVRRTHPDPRLEEKGAHVTAVLALDRSADAIAAATPADRDRYLDFLRGLAITAVVLGHWLISVVWLGDDGLRVSAALDLEPATHWLTWIVQVMPIFFLVGGAVNARSWRATRAADGDWAGWVAKRGARLLRPTTVLVWTWMLLGPVALLAGVDSGLIRLGAAAALVPLWFLAVYLLLIMLVPVLLAAYDRLGLLLPVALLAVAAGIDGVEAAGHTTVGLLNYVVVWSVPTVLGFAWIDACLERRALRIGMPVAALAALLAAVAWFGYPVSMVGLAGGEGPNTPSVALGLLGCVQAGLALALRTPLTRWLARPGPWAAVVRLNMIAMTVYLWHLTVMVLVIAALPALGTWWSVAPLSTAWWLTRPLWVLALAAVLLPVVAALSPIEHTTPRPSGTRSGTRIAMAAVAASGGIALLTLNGVLVWSAVPSALAVTWAATTCGAFDRARWPRRGTLVRMQFVLADARYYDETTAALIEEVQKEYIMRYGGRDATAVDADEFAPPDGAFVLALFDGEPIGCAGLRRHDADVVEIKRMYVRASHRRRGHARRLLRALEDRARDLGYRRVILETGTAQPEAMALYATAGYTRVPGFGHYRDAPESRCYGKDLMAG